MTILQALLKNAILTSNKPLIKQTLKGFIKSVRNNRVYREFMADKKNLELALLSTILTKQSLIQYAIEVNNTDGFIYLLKEFKENQKNGGQ